MLCYVGAITQHTTHRITHIALHKWITSLTLCNTRPHTLCGFAVQGGNRHYVPKALERLQCVASEEEEEEEEEDSSDAEM